MIDSQVAKADTRQTEDTIECGNRIRQSLEINTAAFSLVFDNDTLVLIYLGVDLHLLISSDAIYGFVLLFVLSKALLQITCICVNMKPRFLAVSYDGAEGGLSK